MANIKSAKKRIKTSARNAERNKQYRTEIKTLRKKAEEAISTNKAEKDSILKFFVSRVDSAVSKGIIHKNKAARIKSRMAAKTAKKA
jgi:small subunit ribosomal protein S20